ncbi:MAG TPA: GAF domain-containing protein [Myxococcaceae bacterium]|jgi:GAF domain-containing protein
MSAPSDPTDGTSSTRETWALAINYITGRKRAERALGFLAETSNLLAASLDYRAALGRVAGLTLGYLADFCSIDLLDEGGALAQVGLAQSEHVDPSLLGPLRLYLYPQRTPLTGGVLHALETGKPERMSSEPEGAAGPRAERLAELGGAASLIMPILARGQRLGAISIVSLRLGVAKAYGPEEEALLQQLALRAASAVELARLHEKLRGP